MGSFFVFSVVAFGFRKTSGMSKRHKPSSPPPQVLLRPQERDVIVHAESLKERHIPKFISQNP